MLWYINLQDLKKSFLLIGNAFKRKNKISLFCLREYQVVSEIQPFIMEQFLKDKQKAQGTKFPFLAEVKPITRF